jgi:hypothetical protein
MTAPQKDILSELSARLDSTGSVNVPDCRTFRDYLNTQAKVPLRNGTYGPFSFTGRAPLDFIVTIIDKVLANCLAGQEVEIDGIIFKPGQLKGATFAVGGGAQWGKTILVLNFQGYVTCIQFSNFGYYTPDLDLLNKIVDTKFRPDVLDQNPWMAQMIRLGIAENESGKAVNRKNSYQVTDGTRRAFGHFCGMHKPPTTISLDSAALDEVDDIPSKNMGYVDGRMTGSPLQFKLEIGTQRVAGAGQNARVEAGSKHIKMTPCPDCGASWNLEENFPKCIRVALDGFPQKNDPYITPERGHDREAIYYTACLDCGAELDRDAGSYVAQNPDKVKNAKFSVRVSQLSISAISLQEFVGAWYAALTDPSGEDLVAFYCDRVAIPNAGSAQPITQDVLDRARKLGFGQVDSPAPYAMSLVPGKSPRFAGLDTGPRCWLWVDEVESPLVSTNVWAEMMASGNVPTRLPLLMNALGIQCVFIDAGGEPDLTKRLCLALNGLDEFIPPQMPQTELVKSHLHNIGAGVSWNGARSRWEGVRCVAVLFSSREAKGVEQTIGFTQDGKIYPLIKCNRAESIQTMVNDFLTPDEGVLELVGQDKKARKAPRARLSQTCIGPGVSQAVLDGHLLNVRKIKDTKTGAEDWADKVENHLGLAKVYARLAEMVGGRVTATALQYHVISRTAIKAERTRGLI